MWMPDIIATKRDGGELSEEELAHLVNGICHDHIPREQIGAWLMAVYHNGMTMTERSALTSLMRDSGEVLNWAGMKGVVVDKHSTGGVGDKISLALAPALAACGLKVPMIAGRGLAHTGGTIDKLESIPGFNVDGGEADIMRVVGSAGCTIHAQSQRIAPADGILYAVRDITATVPSIPLITASILSKKAAEGIGALILDIKVGRAAFMQSLPEARVLARSMIDVGAELGIEVRAVLTSMDHPIGSHVGNAHEVLEILDILEGEGSWDTISLIANQGGHLLQMTGIAGSVEAGQMMILNSLSDGSALDHWRRMCVAQGVQSHVVDNMREHLRIASQEFTLHSNISGWVEDIDALELSRVLCEMGAGRQETGEDIDHSIGAVIHAKVGSQVDEGQLIIEVNHDSEIPEDLMTRLESCISISDTRIQSEERLLEVID